MASPEAASALIDVNCAISFCYQTGFSTNLGGRVIFLQFLDQWLQMGIVKVKEVQGSDAFPGHDLGGVGLESAKGLTG